MKRPFYLILLVAFLSGCGFFGGDDALDTTAILTGQVPNDELTPASMITLAKGFEDSGDLTSALRLYAFIASEDPDNLDAQLGLARVYEGASAYNLARRHYGLAFELAPHNGEAAAGVAVGLMRSNETGSARILLENYLATEGGQADVLNILGILLDLEGEHETAQITYARALDLKANDRQIMNNLALSFGLSGDFKAGVAILEDMSRRQQLDRQHVRNLALLHALAGNPERAARVAATMFDGQEQAALTALFERILLLDPLTRRRVVLLGEQPSVLPELPPEPEPEPEPEPDPVLQPEPEPEPVLQPAPEPEPVLQPEPEPEPVLQPEPEPEPVLQPAPEDDEPESLIPPFRPAPSLAGLYWVQIGAFQGSDQMRNAWNILAERYPNALSRLRPHTQSFDAGERGLFTRLLVGGYDRIEVARDQCTLFKGVGLDCFVIFAEEALEQLPRD